MRKDATQIPSDCFLPQTKLAVLLHWLCGKCWLKLAENVAAKPFFSSTILPPAPQKREKRGRNMFFIAFSSFPPYCTSSRFSWLPNLAAVKQTPSISTLLKNILSPAALHQTFMLLFGLAHLIAFHLDSWWIIWILIYHLFGCSPLSAFTCPFLSNNIELLSVHFIFSDLCRLYLWSI